MHFKLIEFPMYSGFIKKGPITIQGAHIISCLNIWASSFSIMPSFPNNTLVSLHSPCSHSYCFLYISALNVIVKSGTPPPPRHWNSPWVSQVYFNCYYLLSVHHFFSCINPCNLFVDNLNYLFFSFQVWILCLLPSPCVSEGLLTSCWLKIDI